MAVHTRCGEHMGATHRHPLSLVDRGGVAMIDVGIVLGVEGDFAAIVGAHGHALGTGHCDRAECPVLHPKPAFVAQEDNAVTRCKLPFAACRLDRGIGTQCASRTHLFARHVVQFAHLVIGVREDDPVIAGAGLPFLLPAFDQHRPCIRARVSDMDHAAFLVGADRFACATRSKLPGGILLPCRKLAANLADLDAAVALVDRPEGRACFDSLELLLVANQDNFRTGLGGMGKHALHLPRADHARFVDHEHVAVGELLASLAPLMLEAGDGARCDAGAVFQTFGSNAGQGRTAYYEARTFPGLARHAQHRAFAGSGVANHDRKTLAVGHVFEGGFLFAGQHQAALYCAGECGVPLHIVDGVTGALCHRIGRAMQALFGLDHRSRSEPILPASVLTQGDQIGRCAHRIVGGIELIFAVAMPVNERRKVALGEGGLLVRDCIQCQRRIGDDPLAIALCNGSVFFDPFCFQPAPADARGGGADLVLRFQRNALCFQAAVIDPCVDVAFRQSAVHMIGPALAPLLDQCGLVPVADLGTEAVLGHAAHRQHDMRVRLGLAVVANVPMDIEIGDHAFLDELGFHELARQLDVFFLRQLAGQGELDLAG